MIDRRGVLFAAGALVASAVIPRAGYASAETLRVAALRFGSLNWLLETIRAEGLAEKAGLNLEIIKVATNQAGPVALLAGEADVIVSDWTWALRQRALGERLKFAPYSSALGAVMVPESSSIAKLADLEGKKLGVAGSAIDKSWLLLRAYSRKTTGRDVKEVARPIFGAAPLLTEEIRNGRIDAVLNFWTYAARLSGSGFRQLVTMNEILSTLGVDPAPPLVGFIWRDEAESRKGEAIATFLDVVVQANDILATSDEAWERIRGLVKPKSDAEFAAIKSFYRAGIPQPWGAAETRSAEKLTQVLTDVGAARLMGGDTKFDPKLFHVAGS